MARAKAAGSVTLDELDRILVNRLQDGIPLVPLPFDAIASEIGCTPDDVIARTARLLDGGVLTRFGPFFDAAAMGGAFCLCAMEVPADRFDDVAAIVNAFDEVAHNYEREHRLNMWFVLATETPEAISPAAEAIARATGIAVLQFPKLEEYFIGFKVEA